MDPSGDITRLISEWQRGNKAAENALFEALYKRLHAKVHLLHSEPRGPEHGADHVHEAYLRLEGEGDARHSGGPGASAFY